MSKNDFKVESTAKTVENETTKKQEKEYEETKKKKEEADKKAESSTTKTTKSKSTKTSSKEEGTEELLTAGAALATAALSNKKSGGFLKGLIVGVVVGLLLGTVFGMKNSLLGSVETTKESADELLDETFTGYTAVDFKNAVLGEASQHQELIVMEQPLEISTTITKAGLGNLSIFSKVKNISYSGTGVYTVDMKDIDEDHITVDEEAKTVTVKIPHTVLQYVNIDYDKVEFEKTDKGLLAFGDLSLTTEQQNELDKSIQSAMKEKLETKELLEKADEFATMKTWEIFQPLITAVSSEYKVEMVFD